MTLTAIDLRDRSPTELSQETVEAFRRCLCSSSLSPMTTGSEATTRLWNDMIEKPPALLVRPNGQFELAPGKEHVDEGPHEDEGTHD